MRNAMSVKEIYEKLDQFDRLKEAYTKEQEKRLNIENIIIHLLRTAVRTGKQYNDVAQACLDAKRFDEAGQFASRSQGVIECAEVLVDYLKDDGFGYIVDRC